MCFFQKTSLGEPIGFPLFYFKHIYYNISYLVILRSLTMRKFKSFKYRHLYF